MVEAIWRAAGARRDDRAVPEWWRIEADLPAKLDTGQSLEFDSYALDIVSRAGVVQKLTVAGVGLGVAMTGVSLTDD